MVFLSPADFIVGVDRCVVSSVSSCGPCGLSSSLVGFVVSSGVEVVVSSCVEVVVSSCGPGVGGWVSSVSSVSYLSSEEGGCPSGELGVSSGGVFSCLGGLWLIIHFIS